MTTTTIMDLPTPPMPGSFYGTESSHLAYNTTFLPPKPSRRTDTSRDSTSRSNSYRSPHSASRHVSRPQSTTQSHVYSNSTANSASTRKRPRLDVHQTVTPPSRLSCGKGPGTETRTTTPQLGSYFGLDGVCDWYPNRAPSNDQLQTQNLDDSLHSLGSPSPLINTQYKLRGGLDTPSASFERSLEDLEIQEMESDWRPNRYTRPFLNDSNDALNRSERTQSPMNGARTPSVRYGSGRKRSYESSHRSSQSDSSKAKEKSISGWGIRSTAWALTGGLAVKAISFAWTTAFSGFRAGGGQAYNMDANIGTPEISNNGMNSNQIEERADVFSQAYGKDELPGQFPGDGLDQDHISRQASLRDGNDFTPTGHGQGFGVGSDWLIIDQTEFQDPDMQSPVKKRSRANVAGTPRRNSGWRNTPLTTNNPRSTFGNSTASYASPRRATATLSTAPHFSSRHRTSSSASNNTNTNISSPERPTSRARPQPTRHLSQDSNPNTTSTSNALTPLSPEAKQYARLIRKKEKVQDETMRRLNSQMKEMIRQGREALGTKFVVEMEVDQDSDCEDGDDGGHRNEDGGMVDEGFYDGDVWRR